MAAMEITRCDTIGGIFGEKDVDLRAAQAGGFTVVRGKLRMSGRMLFFTRSKRNALRAGPFDIGAVAALPRAPT